MGIVYLKWGELSLFSAWLIIHAMYIFLNKE